ncbi:partial dTDP-4-dehydrorhamnose reductase, partial [Anaerolineae bacterium]
NPTVVINAVGIIKQKREAEVRRLAIEVNALFPHLVQAHCREIGAKLIHFSTDCVFDGTKGNYAETDSSTAEDVYGKSKYLGEVADGEALTLRTSILGHGIIPNASLIDWFVGGRHTQVEGFAHAIYSGFPTVFLAKEVVRILKTHRGLSGLYHVASAPISKEDLLSIVRRAYGLDIGITKNESVRIDRSLNGERFSAATGFEAPSWSHLVELMYEDYVNHSYYREFHEANR